MTVAEHAAKDAATLARIEAAFAGLTGDIAWMKAEIVRLGGVIPPVPDTTLAELTDYTASGFSKRLGPTYAELHPTPEVFPDVYVRPLVPIVVGTSGRQFFSEGLGMETTAPYDFSSAEGQALRVPISGLGVDRIRTNQSDGGVVTQAPQPTHNGNPDPDIIWWQQHDSRPGLGTAIAGARAAVREGNCGLVLFSDGYVATVNTLTAHAFIGGIQLPATKKPLSICITSQNEFALVGVHDTTTGKGEVCVIALWGDGTVTNMYHDWPVAHPGLMNASVWVGLKVLGYVDLGIKYPTSLSAVGEANLAKDRIEGPDGNAGLLRDYDLDTQAGRDAFLSKNSEWISHWGHCVVASKPEGKAVFLDLTPLFAAMRAAYFSTQENYDETKLIGEADDQWPFRFAFKPEWTPTVALVAPVPSPTDVLVSEQGTAPVAIASSAGLVYFFKRDGSPDGSLQVGENAVGLAHAKYKGGIRTGAFWVVCRGSRSVSKVSKTGFDAVILKTLKDSRLIDPVSVEEQPTHGIEMEEIVVCDFEGRKLESYRSSVLEFITQGLPSVPVALGAEFEGNPSFPVDGNPFETTIANVN